MYIIIEKNCIMRAKKWKTGYRNAAMQSAPACRMRDLYMCIEKQSAYMSKPPLSIPTTAPICFARSGGGNLIAVILTNDKNKAIFPQYYHIQSL